MCACEGNGKKLEPYNPADRPHLLLHPLPLLRIPYTTAAALEDRPETPRTPHTVLIILIPTEHQEAAVTGTTGTSGTTAATGPSGDTGVKGTTDAVASSDFYEFVL